MLREYISAGTIPSQLSLLSPLRILDLMENELSVEYKDKTYDMRHRIFVSMLGSTE